MKRVLLLCLCFCLACAFPALADEVESLSGNEMGYEIMPLNDDDGGSGGNLYFWKYEREDGEPYREDWASSFTEPVYAYYVMQGTKYHAVYLSRSYFEISCNYGYRGDGTWNLSNSLSKSIVKTSSSGSSVYFYGVVYSGNYFKGAPLDTSISLQGLIDKFAAGEIGTDDPSGGGSSDDYFGDGGATPWKYDSFVPSPVNFKCSVKKSSGIGSIINPNSNILYYLTWSNSEASGYYILLSAQVKIRETGEVKTVWLEDTKRDVGYPATTGSYSPDWVEMEERYDLLWGTYYPISFELRFYNIESGYVHTGNMARCILNVDSNGNYYGSTTDSIELDDSWNQTVKPDDTFTSDVNGNVTNIGGSGGSGGDGEGGNSNTVQNWLDNFLSIPNVLNQFFLSLRNLMSGIGEVPALIGDMFSALPAGILTIMGIGVTLVVVLRIFGR